MIIIDKAVVFDGNRTLLKPAPKTEADNRIIPLPDMLCDALTEYLTELKSLYVFPMSTGEPMTKSAFRRFWEKILRYMQKTAGGKDGLSVVLADDITPHLLRHTYATDLYYAGVGIKVAQYLLGHSSIAMTLEIYTHLDRTNDAVTVDRINQYHNLSKMIQSKIRQ